ncbi:MAG: hypothetical protein V1799_00170 [bacterium]
MNKQSYQSSWIIRVLLVLSLISMSACDLVDPSKVENPQITEDNLLANASGGTTPLLVGLRRRMAITIGNTGFICDLVSDNMDNRTSFYANDLDYPTTIKPVTFTYDVMYESIQTLHALADFGLNVIIPKDNLVTSEQKSEVYFMKGMALVLLAESFTNFPIEEKKPWVSAADANQKGIDALNTAWLLTANTAMKSNIKLALARAYRIAKDKAKAAQAAQDALALGATYVYYAQFDQINVTSALYTALVGRSTNDIQPLPRLDFLDPKFSTQTTSMPVLKTEEAHLILAEAAIANGDLAGARKSMADAVTLARSRSTTTYNDKDARPQHPNDAALLVKADATAPAIAGLIQKRGGSSIVTVYSISGTSVTIAQVNALVAKADHISMLYLLRQEIFFGEGHRMSDLGIRLPVTQRQIDGNTNTADGGPGTRVFVPTYIPINKEMKEFTTTGNTVTIKWDMNRIIAQNINKVSPFGITP